MAFTEDLTPFFADFGMSAVVDGVTVTGLFDNAHADAFMVGGTHPALTVAAADVGTAGVGDGVVISGTTYTIAEMRPDGTGMTTLVLEKS